MPTPKHFTPRLSVIIHHIFLWVGISLGYGYWIAQSVEQGSTYLEAVGPNPAPCAGHLIFATTLIQICDLNIIRQDNIPTHRNREYHNIA